MTTQINKNEKAIRTLEANPFQNWTHNKKYFTASTIIKKYKTFMSIRATATELAQFYQGSGIDFRGSSKSRIAEAITSGSYAGMGFMTSTRFCYETLVNKFGVK